ncbi:hypothetical protein DRO58_00765 [Candidatus Bathyarchaeota archaeon]|nr:MAG: hypothetical protein DRO58_00765 [Candidatus Bathyarchaeota archaeon]
MKPARKAVSTAVSLIAILAALGISMALITYTLYATAARTPTGGQPVVERGSEHLIAYLYGDPKNFTVVNGSIVPKDVRVNCLIHNPGLVPASVERVLALSHKGDVIREAALPEPLTLAPEEYKFLNVSQLLNLPSNYTEFKATVDRLLLKTSSGGVHGSIYARPEFIELDKPAITTTIWKNYTVEVTESVNVTTLINFTVTIPQSKYTLLSKVLESDDGVNFHDFKYGCCKNKYCEYCQKIYGNLRYTSDSWTVTRGVLGEVWPEVTATGKCSSPGSCYKDLKNLQTYQRCSGCYGLSCDMHQVPKIYYIRGGEEVTAKTSVTEYTKKRSAGSCYCKYRSGKRTCYMKIQNWEYKYEFAGIKLIDLDTGEVYASVNKTSITFRLWRNTEVEFLYVLKEKKLVWEKTFAYTEPEPTVYDCADILKQPGDPCNPPSKIWKYCYCQLHPDHECCKPPEGKCTCALSLSIDYCCVEPGKPGTKSCGSARITDKECEWENGASGCRIQISEGETVEGTISGWIDIKLAEGWKVQKVYLADAEGIITSCGRLTLKGEGLVVCRAKCTCNPGDPQSGRSYKSGSASYFAVFVKE